jgi:hypothetical protein
LLAKSSALVLAGLAMIVIAFRTRHPRRAARELAAWSLGAALAGAVLWPAVWVAPGATVSGVLSKAAEEGGAPHSGGNFFLGREVEDPGPLFYPVAEAFRLTPVTTLAALAAIGLAARLARRRRDPGGEGGAVIGFLLVWAALFSLALTLGPKKFDRYALPALVALDVAGGLAIARVAPAGVLAGAVALQLAAAARAGPYGLAYYNPLLGGAPAAVKTILVGWGEGYDLAATWLNRQPHAENLEVSVPGWSNFAPLFAGHTRSAPGYRPGRTDYAVLYVSKVQRRRYESLLEEYHDRGTATPAFVGSLAGIPYVWIYANNTVGPLRDYLDANARPGDVIAADGESVLAKSYSGRARLVETWGHWGETEMREAVASAFPPAWARAWVVRYPGYDPEAPLSVLAEVATRGPTVRLAGGAVEVTRFDRAGAAP